MKKKDSRYFDPLFIIFEKHLYETPHEDLDLFIATVVNEYIDYLKTNQVLIPEKSFSFLMKDLADEVYDMFIKKVHGCLNLKDFQNSGRVTRLEKLLAQDRYWKLTGTEGWHFFAIAYVPHCFQEV